MDLKLVLVLCLTTFVACKSASDITSNEIDQPQHHTTGGHETNRLFPFITPKNGNASVKKSPTEDINVIAGALLDSLLDHKAAIVTSIVNLVNWMLGGLLSELRNFIDKLLGRKSQPPRKAPGFSERRDTHVLEENVFGVDRPITYEDIQLLERLVYDSVEVYRAWQESK